MLQSKFLRFVKPVLGVLINRSIGSGIPLKWKKVPYKNKPISLTNYLKKLTRFRNNKGASDNFL